MQKQCLPIVLLLLLLTACTTGDPVTDVPFATSTSGVVGTVPAPESIGDVAIPSDFTGGEPIILSSQGIFNFAISGEFVEQKDSGTIVYNYLPNTGALPARNQLYIASSDANASQQIAFEFSPEIQIGQYNLIAPEDYFLSGVSAAYSRLVFDGSSTRVESFVENIEGTLTLSSVGEVLSGQFQFTAEYTETSPEGEIDVQAIEVTGSFENVPYQITVDDPFAVDVPLPTRDFGTGATP